MNFIDSCSLLFMGVMVFASVIQLIRHYLEINLKFNLTLILPLSFLTSLILADFTSGFVHWFADTWGAVDWKFIGPTLIRSFREHHIDPLAMIRHNFVETNGASALVSLPILILNFITIEIFPLTSHSFFIHITILLFLIMIIMTNQIHKYAHMKRPPFFIQLLQSKGIILSQEHHAFHHQANFDKSYCMTTGWLNPFLNAIMFFRFVEWIIKTLTDCCPRQDDQKILKEYGGRQNNG